MALEARSLKALVETLEDKDKEISQLASSLRKKISLNKNHFAFGVTLTALLQDQLLPSQTQRIIAIYLLIDLIRRKDGDTFGIVLKEIVQSGDEWEKALIGKLVTKNAGSGNVQSAKDLMKGIDASDEKLKGEAERWVSKFEDKSVKENPKPVSGVVLDPDDGVEKYGLAEELGNEVNLVDFVPVFPKLRPPVMDFDADDAMWMEPQVLHEIVWDPNMGRQNARGAELGELMSKALALPLQPKHQEHLLSLLEADPKMVYYSGMTPEKLPELVKVNPQVAKEVLLKLINSNQISKYFTALGRMELSPNSMEFVSQITNTVQVPPEFLHMFITNCIQSCENESDKYRQNRLVRLVCVFLQTLIKNKAIDASDVFLEVRTFCVDFCRTKEAAALYGVLQNADKA